MIFSNLFIVVVHDPYPAGPHVLLKLLTVLMCTMQFTTHTKRISIYHVAIIDCAHVGSTTGTW